MAPRWGIFPRLGMSTPPGPGTAGPTQARTGEAGGSAATVSTGQPCIGRRSRGKGTLTGGLAPPAHLSSAAIRQPSSNTWIHLSTQCWTRLSSPHPIPALFGWASGSPPRPPTSCHLSCPPKEPGSAEDHRAHTSLASGPAGSSRYFSHPETMSPLLHPKQADSVSSEKLPQHHLPREPTRTLAPFRDTEYMLSPLRSHLPPGWLFSHRPPQGLGQQ